MVDFDIRIVPWAVTLVTHNWPIIVYLLLIPWAAVRAFMRTTRPRLLLLYGLLMLAFEFEYRKHAVSSLDTTLAYVFYHGPQFQQMGRAVLTDLLPLAAQAAGIVMVAVSVVLSVRRGATSPSKAGPNGGE